MSYRITDGENRFGGNGEDLPADIRRAWVKAGVESTVLAFCWTDTSPDRNELVRKECKPYLRYPEQSVNSRNGRLTTTFGRFVTNIGYAMLDGGHFMGADLSPCYDELSKQLNSIRKEGREKSLLSSKSVFKVLAKLRHAHNMYHLSLQGPPEESRTDAAGKYLKGKGFLMP